MRQAAYRTSSKKTLKNACMKMPKVQGVSPISRFCTLSQGVEILSEGAFLLSQYGGREIRYKHMRKCDIMHKCIATQRTEVHFSCLLSGGFTNMAVINPPERKLAKRTSVHWTGHYFTEKSNPPNSIKKLLCWIKGLRYQFLNLTKTQYKLVN